MRFCKKLAVQLEYVDLHVAGGKIFLHFYSSLTAFFMRNVKLRIITVNSDCKPFIKLFFIDLNLYENSKFSSLNVFQEEKYCLKQ